MDSPTGLTRGSVATLCEYPIGEQPADSVHSQPLPQFHFGLLTWIVFQTVGAGTQECLMVLLGV